MLFALVDGERTGPRKGLIGYCPVCDQEVRPRVGAIRAPHWYHLSLRECDHWWEPETEWHRGWKAHFPEGWHEYLHRAPDGERHIADVRTDHGWVIEFQHSYIKPEERQSRDDFYRPLVWVVDGKRRGSDESKFYNVVNGGEQISPLVYETFTKDCPLLRDWEGSKWPIFFDFGQGDDLFGLLKGSMDKPSYFAKLSHGEFVRLLRDGPAQGVGSFGWWLAVCRREIEQHEAPSHPSNFVQRQPHPMQVLLRHPLAPPRGRPRRL